MRREIRLAAFAAAVRRGLVDAWAVGHRGSGDGSDPAERSALPAGLPRRRERPRQRAHRVRGGLHDRGALAGEARSQPDRTAAAAPGRRARGTQRPSRRRLSERGSAAGRRSESPARASRSCRRRGRSRRPATWRMASRRRSPSSRTKPGASRPPGTTNWPQRSSSRSTACAGRPITTSPRPEPPRPERLPGARCDRARSRPAA